MKTLVILISALVLVSCTQSNEKISQLQNQIDSLQKRLTETYKPGFGEFMTYVQSHHAKLWFAGQNENWKLADFEIHEIMEAVENVKKFATDRKESKLIGMITPALDTVNLAIQQKNLLFFRKSYNSLTNTCNLCHRAANFEFNLVKTPETQTFSNQDFKPYSQK
jgi:hypothetical protein